MRKNIILMLLMAAFLAGGAFAQINMSAGLGGNFGVHMTSYSGDGDNPKPIIGGGFHAFFDATYAMAKAGMFIGGQAWGDTSVTLTFFSLGLLGKYPIDLGSFTLFPMLGFEYNLFMSASAEGGKLNRADMALLGGSRDMFILQAGAGADFNITDNIYLRPSLLWGIDLYRNAGEKAAKAAGSSVFKHKLDVGIAVGYKF